MSEDAVPTVDITHRRGFQTSELYVTIITTAASLLLSFQIVDVDQRDAIVALGVSVMPVVMYIISRVFDKRNYYNAVSRTQ